MSVINTTSTKLRDSSKSDTNNNTINGTRIESLSSEEAEEEEEDMALSYACGDDHHSAHSAHAPHGQCITTNNNSNSKECCDECDFNGHRNTARQKHIETNREQLRKQFVDVFRLATTHTQTHTHIDERTSSTPMSSISSMSSSSSRMSSPSPSLSCETPTQPHSPSTLTSIRDAVSHLTRLDDFNVIKLSQGFFSQVFKVTHHSTKKVMVLKMNKHAGNRGNALKETELLNKLNHENIVAFMGTVVHEGALHPLLEYVNGGTLEKLILQYYNIDETKSQTQSQQIIRNGSNTNNGCVSQTQTQYRNYALNDPTNTFVNLATDIARGMDYLHSLHYLHRDLTSKNVFIRKCMPIDDNEPQLSAVIGDFGFAAVEPTADHKLPTVGSPYWMAPECIKGQWYNHKCDIFSFGVICCELNWRIPADPDYLPRNDNFLIVFDKLSPPKDTLLSRIAQLVCQKNPCVRPEFSEILDIFESDMRYSSHNDCIYRRELSQCYNNTFETTIEVNNGCGDIFDQHLIRRRNSQIEKQKQFNGR